MTGERRADKYYSPRVFTSEILNVSDAIDTKRQILFHLSLYKIVSKVLTSKGENTEEIPQSQETYTRTV